MKNFAAMAFTLLCSGLALATVSPSLLNKTVELKSFGTIAYREPVVKNTTQFPVLLVHGIYGGASHRAFRELLTILDSAHVPVYILDLPGVGESERPKRPYSINDLDAFLEAFLAQVVQQRTTVVAESLATASALKVAATRPDLVRRLVLLSPSGVSSLNRPPTAREQGFYDRLYNDDNASFGFYQNLLTDNSLNFYLKFGFYDDSLINEALLDDYRVARGNPDQRYITISFVGGQIWRSFQDSAQGVFVPTLALFGAEYEAFADNPVSKASDFAAIRPDFEYVEIPKCGASVQREKPLAVAQEILRFHE